MKNEVCRKVSSLGARVSMYDLRVASSINLKFTRMFSVIIPTYREGKYLGKLLESIKLQKLQPSEIIVADRYTGDNTRDVATAFGCKVVEGGIASVGRNAGAKVAKESILVFLDSDTLLSNKTFFNQLVGKFIKNDFDIASCYLKQTKEDYKITNVQNVGMNLAKLASQVTAKVSKKVVGETTACVIVKKKLFESLNGFDEKLEYNEDTDFFRRAIAANAKYSVINISIPVSSRRFAKRSLESTLKVGVLGVALLVGTYFGVKAVGKLRKKYEKEKGNMGGD